MTGGVLLAPRFDAQCLTMILRTLPAVHAGSGSSFAPPSAEIKASSAADLRVSPARRGASFSGSVRSGRAQSLLDAAIATRSAARAVETGAKGELPLSRKAEVAFHRQLEGAHEMLMSQQAGVVRATVLIANENESEHDSFRAMVSVAQAPTAIQRPLIARGICRDTAAALHKKRAGRKPCLKNCVDPISPRNFDLILPTGRRCLLRARASSRDLARQARSLSTQPVAIVLRPSLPPCHHSRQRLSKLRALFKMIGTWAIGRIVIPRDGLQLSSIRGSCSSRRHGRRYLRKVLGLPMSAIVF